MMESPWLNTFDMYDMNISSDKRSLYVTPPLSPVDTTGLGGEMQDFEMELNTDLTTHFPDTPTSLCCLDDDPLFTLKANGSIHIPGLPANYSATIKTEPMSPMKKERAWISLCQPSDDNRAANTLLNLNSDPMWCGMGQGKSNSASTLAEQLLLDIDWGSAPSEALMPELLSVVDTKTPLATSLATAASESSSEDDCTSSESSTDESPKSPTPALPIESLDYNNPVTREHSYHMRIPSTGIPAESLILRSPQCDSSSSPPDTDEEVDVVTVSDVAVVQRAVSTHIDVAAPTRGVSSHYTMVQQPTITRAPSSILAPLKRSRSSTPAVPAPTLRVLPNITSVISSRRLAAAESARLAPPAKVARSSSLLASGYHSSSSSSGRQSRHRSSGRGYGRGGYGGHHERETEGRGSQHNELERKRRNDLKDNFRTLRRLVPSLAHNDKASKVMILDNATAHARDLVLRERVMEASREAEAERMRELQARVAELKVIIAEQKANGAFKGEE